MTLGQILFGLYVCMIVSALFSLSCRIFRLSENVQKCVLALECVLFFVGVPLLFALTPYSSLQTKLIIDFCCLCIMLLHLMQHITTLCEWVAQGTWPGIKSVRTYWRKAAETMLRRIAAGAIALSILLLLLRPADFLAPLRRPGWIVMVLVYSMISAPPQEYIYRKFFFDRYRLLFPSDRSMFLASSAAFGFVHIVFRHPLTLVLTFVAGLWFADSYRRYDSLLLPSIEHALYGSLTFTLGYHSYFHFA